MASRCTFLGDSKQSSLERIEHVKSFFVLRRRNIVKSFLKKKWRCWNSHGVLFGVSKTSITKMCDTRAWNDEMYKLYEIYNWVKVRQQSVTFFCYGLYFLFFFQTYLLRMRILSKIPSKIPHRRVTSPDAHIRLRQTSIPTWGRNGWVTWPGAVLHFPTQLPRPHSFLCACALLWATIATKRPISWRHHPKWCHSILVTRPESRSLIVPF